MPGTGLALPATQPMHEALLAAPVSGLYVPATQPVNVCLTLAAPVAAQKPPIGQVSQAVASKVSLNVPAGQGMQVRSDRAAFGL